LAKAYEGQGKCVALDWYLGSFSDPLKQTCS